MQYAFDRTHDHWFIGNAAADPEHGPKFEEQGFKVLVSGR
jgi:hypothetical protein